LCHFFGGLGWAGQEIGTGANPLTAEEWTALLENAGLTKITAQTYEINIQDESKGILAQYGFGEFMKILGRMLKLYFRNPEYRAFVNNLKKEGVTPNNLDEYFGYGLYIGQK